MGIITLELIRRRAEHNEGLIHTLEEISLHQEEIEAIGEVLGKNCRHLKILYLQNNIISRMEGLHHLKELEYLNLALNNITAIEGLGSCEMLSKLDLTVNFIDLDRLEDSLQQLAACPNLTELYMMGNPAQANWDGFVPYVVACLPQLERLDGVEVTRSVRITAKQQLPRLQAELVQRSEQVRRQKADKAAAKPKGSGDIEGRGEPSQHPAPVMTEVEFQQHKQQQPAEESTPHTPEVRTQIYRELAEQKREKQERERANLPKERNYEQEHKEAIDKAREREQDGVIRQCNEGKLDFSFDELSQPGQLLLDVAVPRFLDSSLIDVDVHPHYISVVIKGKVLRLQLPLEVVASASRAQRSKTSGHLVVHMPKLNSRETMGLAPAARLTQPRRRAEPSAKARSTPRQAMSLADMMIVEAQARKVEAPRSGSTALPAQACVQQTDHDALD